MYGILAEQDERLLLTRVVGARFSTNGRCEGSRCTPTQLISASVGLGVLYLRPEAAFTNIYDINVQFLPTTLTMVEDYAQLRRVSSMHTGRCAALRLPSRGGCGPRISATHYACAVLVVALVATSEAANPVVPNVGMADPHVHTWQRSGGDERGVAPPITAHRGMAARLGEGGDPRAARDGGAGARVAEAGAGYRFWMYSTHDFAPNNTGFRMDDWRVWASDDLVAWDIVDTVKPTAFEWDTGSAMHECWATDAAVTADGSSTVFFVSAGPTQIGVLKSSNGHGGPFIDPIGAPLIPSGLVDTQARDPAAFKAADGTVYLVFGTFDYYIARLCSNLTALAEKPRPLVIKNALGPYGPGKTDDKPFMHEFNGVHYLSWGAFYATGASPYGPFTFRGTVINEGSVAEGFSVGNRTAEPWYSREDYADRHGSFFTFGEQWYWATNDRSHSNGVLPSAYRDTVVGYVHYNSDGTIAPVVINATGVGEYDGSPGAVVEAECFFQLLRAEGSAAQKQQFATAGGGFVVSRLGSTPRTTDVLVFPRIHGVNLTGSVVVRAVVASSAATGESCSVSAALATEGASDRQRHARCRSSGAGSLTAGIHDLECLWIDSGISSSERRMGPLTGDRSATEELVRLELHVACEAAAGQRNGTLEGINIDSFSLVATGSVD